jgi:hypothetical protein
MHRINIDAWQNPDITHANRKRWQLKISTFSRTRPAIHVFLDDFGICKLWKKPNWHTNEFEYVFLFYEPLKGSKSLKIFKINLTFRFDKWWHLSKSVHIGENSQILIVSNKKRIFALLKNWTIGRLRLCRYLFFSWNKQYFRNSIIKFPDMVLQTYRTKQSMLRAEWQCFVLNKNVGSIYFLN